MKYYSGSLYPDESLIMWIPGYADSWLCGILIVRNEGDCPAPKE